VRPAVLSSRRLIARHVPPAAQAVAEQWRRGGHAQLEVSGAGGWDALQWFLDADKPRRIRQVLEAVWTLRTNARLRHRDELRTAWRALYRQACMLMRRVDDRSAFELELATFRHDLERLTRAERDARLIEQRAARRRGPAERDAAYEAQLLAPGNKAAIERAIFEYRGLLRGAQIDAVLDALPRLKPALSEERLKKLFKGQLKEASRGRKGRE
jgi:hypothetical protein